MSSASVAGRKNHPDGGGSGFDLITNQPRAPPSPRRRVNPQRETGMAAGRVDARAESTTYDLVTGQAKSAPRKSAPRKEAAREKPQARPRRSPSQAKANAAQADVDVLGRARPPSSPRKRGNGKSTLTLMDEAGGGLNPVTGEKVAVNTDPRRSAKAKRSLERSNSNKKIDPVTHKAAPYGTDAQVEPAPQKPSSVRRMARETRELHKDVNPLTGEKKKAAALPRSTSGQFSRETAVRDPVNPVTGSAAPPSPRKKAGAQTTGAFTKEQKTRGKDVDIHGNPKTRMHSRRSSSGFIDRQVADNQSADPITGQVVNKAPVKGTKGRLTRELSDRPTNPVTGE